MLRFKIFFICFLCFSIYSFGINKNVKIGIYNTTYIKEVVVSVAYGSYEIYGDNQKITIFSAVEPLVAELKLGKIHIKLGLKSLGNFTAVKIKRKDWGSSFKLKIIRPYKPQRVYKDHLLISVSGKRLKLINDIYIENYVSGVVEAEAGTKQVLEYYKVQSIIVRTYALANYKKHLLEGYNLCDKVHCQVYKGRSFGNPDILKSVLETREVVLVDSDIKLITAGFHSNCGGETVNSEDVWKYPVSYLKSVCDTFCTAQPHAFWEKEILKSKWIFYLKKNKFDITDSMKLSCWLDFSPENRQTYFDEADSTLLMSKIRLNLGLRSTYFTITEQQNLVKFTGNGFGHGIGVCQEGAMNMAKSGIKFNEILHHYYTAVHLIDLENLYFFRDY